MDSKTGGLLMDFIGLFIGIIAIIILLIAVMVSYQRTRKVYREVNQAAIDSNDKMTEAIQLLAKTIKERTQ